MKDKDSNSSDPPRVTFPASSNNVNSNGSAELRRRRPSSFRNVATMVMQMNKQSKRDLISGEEGSNNPGAHTDGARPRQQQTFQRHQSGDRGGHQRVYSASNLPYNNNPSPQLANTSLPPFFESSAPTSTLLDHAQHLENLFQMPAADSYSSLPQYAYGTEVPYNNQYNRQRTASVPEVDDEEDESGQEDRDNDDDDVSDISSGGDDDDTNNNNVVSSSRDDIEQGRQHAGDTTPLITGNNNNGQATPTNRFLLRAKRFYTLVIRPDDIWASIKHFLCTTVLLFIIPGLIAAAIFYYTLDNPDLEFLPTSARLSWFILFAIRLSITFTLAQCSQWILEILTVRTTIFASIAGPLPTLLAMQSMGWPFLIASWGCWNILLLHGDSPFVKHWLYWTNIKLFSIQYNTGDGLLASDMYGRLLGSMVVLGFAAAAKQTFVALYFSRRMLQHYKKKLEKVMSQVKLIMEVAELAAQTEQPDFQERLAIMHKEGGEPAIVVDRSKKSALVESVPMFQTEKEKKQMVKSPSGEKKVAGGEGGDDEDVGGGHDDDDDDDDDDDVSSHNGTNRKPSHERQPTGLDARMKWNMLKQQALNDRNTMNFAAGEDASTTGRSKGHQRSAASKSLMTNRGNLKMIYPFLERWPEPEDKGRRGNSPTLHDILQFKKAMAFMETDFPFTPAYGSAADRKQCVKNAVKLYRRLLRFTPDSAMLSFDVIGALAFRENGTLDENRAIALLQVFLPDKDDLLPMLAFVQSCDNVYKQLRYLRASISNSSKIDSVLEDIFNGVFYAILIVFLLSLLGFNPWPLLASFSAVTLSFAFAFGPSVAKNVEGVLMIAVRRPYDIGDRITISGAENPINPPLGSSWLVEDITLTTSTLRFAGTNEVATINNASVANSRIVNCARSPKAQVTITIKLKVDTTQRQLEEFRAKMESYLEDRPRIWVGLILYRTEDLDSDNGWVMMIYRAQHVKSWQELGAIMSHRGDWQKFADTTATEMGIVLDTPPRMMTVGLGLAPKKNPAVEDRKKTEDFIRSLSRGGDGVGDDGARSEKNDDKVFGSIADYIDASQTPIMASAMEGIDHAE